MKKTCVFMGAIVLAAGVGAYNHVSDAYIRARVVLLTGNEIKCTGVQVRAPSGQDYLITAGHCGKVIVNNKVSVTTEDSRTLQRSFIAEDPTSDLLVLEGLPGVRGLDIGRATFRFMSVRAFTRGQGKPTYETDGTVVGVATASAPIELTEAECVGPKYTKIPDETLGTICLLSVEETGATAAISPGSSGGPLLDDSGDVVGIASMTNDIFSTWVRVSDIRAFLAGY